MRVIPSQQFRVKRLDNARYHGDTRAKSSINLIVTHATAGESADSSIRHLNRKNSDNPASYHYIIDRDGTIVRTLPVETVAYHAGDSRWPNPTHWTLGGNKSSVNPRSIGIAFANRDDGEPLTDEQLTSGLWLHRFWMNQLGLSSGRVVGHYEVSPGRKPDPRPCLSMREFRQMLADTEIK
jgi:N-acetylmuramoyl-L-alanine amidase